MVSARRVARRLRLLVAVCAVAAGCGGGDEPQPDGGNQAPNPSPSDPGQIRGTERIAWDQFEFSPDRLSRYSFVLYVDGRGTPLSDTQCGGDSKGAGVVCSARLPTLSSGTHVLQMSASLDGRESQRSAPVTVVVARGATAVDTSYRLPDRGTTPTAEWCEPIRTAPCLVGSTVFESQSPLTAPVPTPDGRLMLIEGERAVRVLHGRSVRPEPAFVASASTTRLVGLAVDPRFAATRAVYVAWIDESAPNLPTLSVSRFRDVDDRLGEEAVVIPNVPLALGVAAKLALDSQARVYLALTGPSRESPGSGQGALLRFTSDGEIPWADGQTSPLLAPAPAIPTGLTLDASEAEAWVAGVSALGQPELAIVTLGARSSVASTVEALPTGSDQPSTVRGLAVFKDAAPLPARFVLVDNDGALWLGRPSSEPRNTRYQRLMLPLGPAVDVSTAREGGVHVVIRTPGPWGPATHAVVLLAPAP
jgi:hypothetical protein